MHLCSSFSRNEFFISKYNSMEKIVKFHFFVECLSTFMWPFLGIPTQSSGTQSSFLSFSYIYLSITTKYICLVNSLYREFIGQIASWNMQSFWEINPDLTTWLITTHFSEMWVAFVFEFWVYSQNIVISSTRHPWENDPYFFLTLLML